MKKALLVSGLFSLVMVLTSFTSNAEVESRAIETSESLYIVGAGSAGKNQKLDIVGAGSAGKNQKLDIVGAGSAGKNQKLD